MQHFVIAMRMILSLGTIKLICSPCIAVTHIPFLMEKYMYSIYVYACILVMFCAVITQVDVVIVFVHVVMTHMAGTGMGRLIVCRWWWCIGIGMECSAVVELKNVWPG